LHSVGPGPKGAASGVAIVPVHDFRLVELAVLAELELPVNPTAVVEERHNPVVMECGYDYLTVRSVCTASIENDCFRH